MKKGLWIKCLGLLGALGFGNGLAQAAPLDRIFTLERAGVLSKEAAMDEKLKALFQPDALHKDYKESRPSRAATMAHLEVFKEFPRLSSRQKEWLATRGILSRDDLASKGAQGRRASANAPQTYVTLSGPEFFTDIAGYRLHYTFSGQDATTQEMVDAVKTIIGDTLAIQHTTLGFTPPPPDTDGLYHVYFSDKEGGSDAVYGKVVPIKTIGDNPKSQFIKETNALSSYMVLDNDFSVEQFGGNPLQDAKVTFAHEHLHSIQFGYTVFANSVSFDDIRWFFESTATWMETKVYPTLSGPNVVYGSELFRNPGKYPMDGLGQWPYASFIYHRYLDEQDNKGQSIPKIVLERGVSDGGTIPNQHWKNAIESTTRFTRFSDLMLETQLALVYLSTNGPGTDKKYALSQAAFLQTSNTGVPNQMDKLQTLRVTGDEPQTLTNDGSSLMPLSSQFVYVTVEKDVTLSLKPRNAELQIAVIQKNGEVLSSPVQASATGQSPAQLPLKKGEAWIQIFYNNPTISLVEDQSNLTNALFDLEFIVESLSCGNKCSALVSITLPKPLLDLGETAPRVTFDVVKSDQPQVSCLKTPMAGPDTGEVELEINGSLCEKNEAVDLLVTNVPGGYARNKDTGNFTCLKKTTVEALTSGSKQTCVLAKGKAAGDSNGDQKINISDFGKLKSLFGQKAPNLEADFDGDGDVDIADFGVLRRYFGLDYD